MKQHIITIFWIVVAFVIYNAILNYQKKQKANVNTGGSFIDAPESTTSTATLNDDGTISV